MANGPSLLKRCKSVPRFGDHNSTILSDIQCHPQLLKPTQWKIYNWNKADIGQVRADVATHMDMFIQKNIVQTPINNLWQKFNSTINLPTKYVPSKLTSERFTHAWLTKSCKSKVRKKKLYIKVKRANLTSDWNNFWEAAAAARKTCKEAYHNFVSKAFWGNSSTNLRWFFSYVKPKDVRMFGQHYYMKMEP